MWAEWVRGQVDRVDKMTSGLMDRVNKWIREQKGKGTNGKNGRMNKMTEDNCRIGDHKVMTNTKVAPKKLAYLAELVQILRSWCSDSQILRS